MIEVWIPAVGQEVGDSEKTHTVFKVEVLINGRKHFLEKRYREFHALHKKIKKVYKVPDFPPKRVPNWRSKVLEQRRQALEAYIQGVLSRNQSVPKELLVFLNVKQPSAGAKSISIECLNELNSMESSLRLFHRPVVGFCKDPYVFPSSDSLVDIIVDGVLQGFYPPELNFMVNSEIHKPATKAVLLPGPRQGRANCNLLE
ncbi:sorting nexin-24 isoform X1 [Latimeria chalumnae]|uniref:sorting nexin-24 isoform X1 n=1 Tax=Latimeria chalumnae TaxID=7897 RepID=UPI0006D90719|nr:PREDICTED: sorting nexin-22 [Latimeria chalumnae]|eukprot:XP_014342774.1 PREDICTED: sorting nexin-22 [Latimeria chalumnae]